MQCSSEPTFNSLTESLPDIVCRWYLRNKDKGLSHLICKMRYWLIISKVILIYPSYPEILSIWLMGTPSKIYFYYMWIQFGQAILGALDSWSTKSLRNWLSWMIVSIVTPISTSLISGLSSLTTADTVSYNGH